MQKLFDNKKKKNITKYNIKINNIKKINECKSRHRNEKHYKKIKCMNNINTEV